SVIVGLLLLRRRNPAPAGTLDRRFVRWRSGNSRGGYHSFRNRCLVFGGDHRDLPFATVPAPCGKAGCGAETTDGDDDGERHDRRLSGDADERCRDPGEYELSAAEKGEGGTGCVTHLRYGER